MLCTRECQAGLAPGINRSGEVGKHLTTIRLFHGPDPRFRKSVHGPSRCFNCAIEDFSGELVHDYDPTVLWGAPIISWSGDFQPLEIAHAMPAEAPRWGKGWRNWMRDNYSHITSMYSQTANIPTTETYVDLDPERKDPLGSRLFE